MAKKDQETFLPKFEKYNIIIENVYEIHNCYSFQNKNNKNLNVSLTKKF
jgi:hypothetical protein